MAVVPDIEGFIDYLRGRKYSAATVKARETGIRRFVGYMESHDVTRFQDVSLELVEQYRTSLVDEGLTANSMENYLWSVRMLFDYLEENMRIFDNPTRLAAIHRPPPRLPQVISVKEMHRLLNAPDTSTGMGIRDRAILEALYSTGMRREEMSGLRITDVDVKEGTVRVMGKGRKERVLPLGKHAVHWIELYLLKARPTLVSADRPPIDALWLSWRHGPLAEYCITRMVRTYARLAGITSPVSTHTLRRSCATHMLNNGAHPLVVAELLGHGDLTTLNHYLRVNVTDLKETHAKTRPGR